MSDVTQILNQLRDGDPRAAGDLMALVYDDLRRLAARHMARESPGVTLQATALVHEAWMRLAGEDHDWDNRRHFFSAAAEAMRRILIDRVRQKRRIRHGGGLDRVSMEDLDVATEEKPEALLFVHEALERLSAKDPKVAELIKLRYFAGVPNGEAATLLGLSDRSATRAWAYARAWLARELGLMNQGR